MSADFTANQQWNQTQKQFYDSRDHKRMWHTANSLFVRNVLNKFLSLADLNKNDLILEIGCGAGRYTIPLLQSGYRITALDISQRMIEKLKKDLALLEVPQDRYALHQGDFDQLQWGQPQKFDAVIGFNVLHHLFDINFTLQRAAQLIEKSGQAVFLEPNALNPLHALDTFLDRGWKAEHHKSLSLPQNVQRAMENNGFHKIEYQRFGFFPPFLISRCPGLIHCEHAIEKNPLVQTVLPYFIIKGIKL